MNAHSCEHFSTTNITHPLIRQSVGLHTARHSPQRRRVVRVRGGARCRAADLARAGVLHCVRPTTLASCSNTISNEVTCDGFTHAVGLTHAGTDVRAVMGSRRAVSRVLR